MVSKVKKILLFAVLCILCVGAVTFQPDNNMRAAMTKSQINKKIKKLNKKIKKVKKKHNVAVGAEEYDLEEKIEELKDEVKYYKKAFKYKYKFGKRMKKVLYVGKVYDLLDMRDLYENTISFRSSKPSVVSIKGYKLYAKGSGKAKITAKASVSKKKTSLTVTAIVKIKTFECMICHKKLPVSQKVKYHGAVNCLDCMKKLGYIKCPVCVSWKDKDIILYDADGKIVGCTNCNKKKHFRCEGHKREEIGDYLSVAIPFLSDDEDATYGYRFSTAKFCGNSIDYTQIKKCAKCGTLYKICDGFGMESDGEFYCEKCCNYYCHYHYRYEKGLNYFTAFDKYVFCEKAVADGIFGQCKKCGKWKCNTKITYAYAPDEGFVYGDGDGVSFEYDYDNYDYCYYEYCIEHGDDIQSKYIVYDSENNCYYCETCMGEEKALYCNGHKRFEKGEEYAQIDGKSYCEQYAKENNIKNCAICGNGYASPDTGITSNGKYYCSECTNFYCDYHEKREENAIPCIFENHTHYKVCEKGLNQYAFICSKCGKYDLMSCKVYDVKNKNYICCECSGDDWIYCSEHKRKEVDEDSVWVDGYDYYDYDEYCSECVEAGIVKQCVNCKKWRKSDDDGMEEDGKYYCSDCVFYCAYHRKNEKVSDKLELFDETNRKYVTICEQGIENGYIKQCEICGLWYTGTSKGIDYYDKYYCANCSDIFYCSYHESYDTKTIPYIIEDPENGRKKVCRKAIADKFVVKCPECEKYEFTEQVVYDEENEKHFCRSCMKNNYFYCEGHKRNEVGKAAAEINYGKYYCNQFVDSGQIKQCEKCKKWDNAEDGLMEEEKFYCESCTKFYCNYHSKYEKEVDYSEIYVGSYGKMQVCKEAIESKYVVKCAKCKKWDLSSEMAYNSENDEYVCCECQ